MPAQPRSRELPSPEIAGPLLRWLLIALAPMNRTRVKQLLTHGRIHVNGTSITRHDHILQPGDHVSIGEAKTASTLPIIYEDDAVVVIDKPAGLLSVATESEKEDTAFVRLAAVLPARPSVVHRLDRETSGLLLFARSNAIRDQLQKTWDEVEKTYLAVVEGTLRQREGIIDNFLLEGKSLRVTASPSPKAGAKRAVSRYRVLKPNAGLSLVEVIIETGRKHQIRVHLAGLGCPIIGDSVYGATTNPAKRLGLHAHRLAFEHPITRKRIEIESPLPAALARIV
jgi:23S rRNA pseudouridine1911/1915/1917 synthase